MFYRNGIIIEAGWC